MRKQSKEEHSGEPQQVMQRQEYEMFLQACSYGFARAMYDWRLQYAESELSEQGFKFGDVAWS